MELAWQKNQDILALRKVYEKQQGLISQLNKRMEAVRLDREITGAEKTAELDRLSLEKNMITEELATSPDAIEAFKK